jgi:hypothetical protein
MANLRHDEAPTIPNKAGSGRAARFSSAREKTTKNSAGIDPRDFQFETADGETSTRPAAALVPPTASITASTDLSTPCEYSRSVNMSSVHTTAIAAACELALIHAMDTAKTIGKRLIATVEALEMKPAELCRQIGIAPNRWSQYANGERRITIAVSIKLAERYGVTLDWIYRGDPSALPQRLHQKIKVAA